RWMMTTKASWTMISRLRILTVDLPPRVTLKCRIGCQLPAVTLPLHKIVRKRVARKPKRAAKMARRKRRRQSPSRRQRRSRRTGPRRRSKRKAAT
ncbi:hypothetical protein FRC09_007170, partial [Ceratobasidium sp. 395]